MRLYTCDTSRSRFDIDVKGSTMHCHHSYGLVLKTHAVFIHCQNNLRLGQLGFERLTNCLLADLFSCGGSDFQQAA